MLEFLLEDWSDASCLDVCQKAVSGCVTSVTEWPLTKLFDIIY